MPVLIDTGPLVGHVNPKDPHHEEATQLLTHVASGADGPGIIPHVVRMEALTFLRGKMKDPEASLTLQAMMDGFLDAEMTRPLLKIAEGLHFQHWDRRLSMIDCAVIAHANALDAKAATFESNWEGLVPLVR